MNNASNIQLIIKSDIDGMNQEELTHGLAISLVLAKRRGWVGAYNSILINHYNAALRKFTSK